MLEIISLFLFFIYVNNTLMFIEAEIKHGKYYKEDFRRTRVIAAAVHVKMRQMHAMPADPRGGAARDSGDYGVLPRSLEVQMWKQVVHALVIHACIYCKSICQGLTCYVY